ncbi:MAG TPA: 16S rRNA (cytosine(1402)-N(4))-methyltransferase RsmH [Desertimonas sp.]|nr:16S rRNA (cytosine(1402)-N(4))-methyltransferase RsmH [Desertimonas sp.]
MTEPDFAHEPVMVDEIVTVFTPVPPGTVLDATLGGGGHAEALLDQCPHLSVLGLDRDEQALSAARRRLRRFGSRATTVLSRFDRLAAVMADSQIASLAGALFDLGVSSPQLDDPERGFSYRLEGPLDMRMDPRRGKTAADVVNGDDVDDLARIIHDYGDERFATRVARAIVAARPITTTTELAAVVTAAIPAATRRTGGHPAKRTFQALRIAVNDELDQLPGSLDQAIDATVTRGRVAVLTYHSGEDRLVKQRFAEATSGGCTCPPGLPCVCGATPIVRRVRAPRTPSADQTAGNRRARSARLRVVEKLGAAP